MENIIVRVYESGQYEGSENSIISDFMHTIGIELTEEYKKRDKLMNTNVDLICTEIKRKLNEFPEFCSRKGYIRKYMSQVTDKYKEKGKYQFKSLFMPKAQDEFLKKYEEENEKTAREWLNREDGRLFYAPISYDDKKKEFSSKDYIKTCGEIISILAEDNEKLKEEIEQKKQR